VKKTLNIRFLHSIALILILTGAVGSLVLTFHTGRKNNSVLLPLLFAVWVLSPFIAFLMSDIISRSWPVFVRAALYCFIIVLTVSWLLCYGGLLSPPGVKPAFVFLIVPLISWILLVILIPLSELLSRRLSNKNDKL
jgi:hypothetical protein